MMAEDSAETIAMTSLSQESLPLEDVPEYEATGSSAGLCLPPPASDSPSIAQPLSESEAVQAGKQPGQPVSAFRALPMPKSTVSTGVGPRLTKAAALRMGITVTPSKVGSNEAIRAPTTKSGETPGYKRTGLNIVVKSLASPSVTPRPTRASMIRCGQMPVSSPSGKQPPVNPLESFRVKPGQKHVDPDNNAMSPAAPTIAARQNRASLIDGQVPGRAPNGGSSVQAGHGDSLEVAIDRHAAAAERRKSMAVASLTAPSVTPRQTKASVLRAGGGSNIPAAENSKKRFNEMTAEEKAERNRKLFAGVPGHRQTSSVSAPPKSLMTPGIAPRLNRAVMLRTAPALAAGGAGDAKTDAARRSSLAVQADCPAAKARVAHTRTQSVPFVAPRPTKASLLREQNGGKA